MECFKWRHFGIIDPGPSVHRHSMIQGSPHVVLHFSLLPPKQHPGRPSTNSSNALARPLPLPRSRPISPTYAPNRGDTTPTRRATDLDASLFDPSFDSQFGFCRAQCHYRRHAWGRQHGCEASVYTTSGRLGRRDLLDLQDSTRTA